MQASLLGAREGPRDATQIAFEHQEGTYINTCMSWNKGTRDTFQHEIYAVY